MAAADVLTAAEAPARVPYLVAQTYRGRLSQRIPTDVWDFWTALKFAVRSLSEVLAAGDGVPPVTWYGEWRSR